MAATSLRFTARLFQPRSYQLVVRKRKWTFSIKASAVMTFQVAGVGAHTAASSPMPSFRPGARPGLWGEANAPASRAISPNSPSSATEAGLVTWLLLPPLLAPHERAFGHPKTVRGYCTRAACLDQAARSGPRRRGPLRLRRCRTALAGAAAVECRTAEGR